MRLEARIEKLEKKQGGIAPDASGYDDRRDYDDHVWYMLTDGGVMCVTSLYDGHGRYDFASEEELWKIYPTGTKFLRTGGGDFEVIDGVMRKLKFYYDGKPLSPEIRECFDRVMNTAD